MRRVLGAPAFSLQKHLPPVREPEGVRMSAPTALWPSLPRLNISLTFLYVEPHPRATNHLHTCPSQQEKERKDAVGLPTVGNALTVGDDVHQPSALYHLYAIRREENSWS